MGPCVALCSKQYTAFDNPVRKQTAPITPVATFSEVRPTPGGSTVQSKNAPIADKQVGLASTDDHSDTSKGKQYLTLGVRGNSSGLQSQVGGHTYPISGAQVPQASVWGRTPVTAVEGERSSLSSITFPALGTSPSPNLSPSYADAGPSPSGPGGTSQQKTAKGPKGKKGRAKQEKKYRVATNAELAKRYPNPKDRPNHIVTVNPREQSHKGRRGKRGGKKKNKRKQDSPGSTTSTGVVSNLINTVSRISGDRDGLKEALDQTKEREELALNVLNEVTGGQGYALMNAALSERSEAAAEDAAPVSWEDGVESEKEGPEEAPRFHGLRTDGSTSPAATTFNWSGWRGSVLTMFTGAAQFLKLHWFKVFMAASTTAACCYLVSKFFDAKPTWHRVPSLRDYRFSFGRQVSARDEILSFVRGPTLSSRMNSVLEFARPYAEEITSATAKRFAHSAAGMITERLNLDHDAESLIDAAVDTIDAVNLINHRTSYPITTYLSEQLESVAASLSDRFWSLAVVGAKTAALSLVVPLAALIPVATYYYAEIDEVQQGEAVGRDERPIDLAMGPIKYASRYDIVDFREGVGFVTPWGTFRVTTNTRLFRVDAAKFFHGISIRNVASSDPALFVTRITQALRTQSSHGSSRYQSAEGEEVTLLHLCLRWAKGYHSATEAVMSPLSVIWWVFFVLKSIISHRWLPSPIWLDMVVSPVMEEVVTRLDPWYPVARTVIILLEVFMTSFHSRRPRKIRLLMACWRVLMHAALAMCPLVPAILIHAGVNTALYLHAQNKRLFLLSTPRYLYGYGPERTPAVKSGSAAFNYRVTRNATSKPPRPVAVQIGPIMDTVFPRPNLNNLQNAADAMRGRMGKVPATCTDATLGALVETSAYLAATRLKPLSPSADVDFEHWLNETKYSESRKDQLRAAYEDTADGNAANKRHEWVNVHIKDEPYPEFKFPRGIWARVDASKVLEGPLFHLIEKEVFALPEFVKTVPVAERAEFMKERFGSGRGDGKVLLETDFSKMESHFVYKVMAIEFAMYSYMVQFNPRLQILLRRVGRIILGRNKCNWRRVIWVIIVARRLSGEMNTSLGNGWANWVLLNHAVYMITGRRDQLTCVVEGDDGLLLVDEAVAAQLTPEHMATLGFDLKLEVRPDVLESLFCGTVQTETGSNVLYDPLKFLSNIGWSRAPHVAFGINKRRALLRVKALSFISMFPTTPVVREYCEWAIRETEEVHNLARRLVETRGHFDARDRAHYAQVLEEWSPSKLEAPRPTIDESLLVEQVYGMTIEAQRYYISRIERFKEYEPRGPLVPTVDTHIDQITMFEYVSDSDRVHPLTLDTEVARQIEFSTRNPDQLQLFTPLSCLGLALRMSAPVPRRAEVIRYHQHMNGSKTQSAGGSAPKGAANHPTTRQRQQQKLARFRQAIRNASRSAAKGNGRRVEDHARPGQVTPGGGGELARLGDKTRRGTRAAGTGSGPSPSRPPVGGTLVTPSGKPIPSGDVVRYYHAETGELVGAGKKVKSMSRAIKAPLANGHVYTGMETAEHEFIDHGMRHLRVAGRELLYAISAAHTSAIVYNTGCRLPGCITAISPKFLGGRLALLSDQFEQHKVHRLRVTYVPSVPATTSGAIALAFRNDISMPTLEIGMSELAHLATLGAFVQTPVWQEVSLDIEPSSAYVKYFDQDNQDYRLEVQGVIETIAASAITLDASGTAGIPNLGEVYLEYDMEFFGESLDFDVPMREYTLLTVSATAATGAVVKPYIVRFRNGSGFAGVPGFSTTLPLGATAYTDLKSWVFYGTITYLTGNWTGAGSVTFTTGESSSVRKFQVGQAIWISFSADDSGTIQGLMASDLNSLGTGMYNSYAPTDGVLVWEGGTFTTNSDLQMYGCWVKTGL